MCEHSLKKLASFKGSSIFLVHTLGVMRWTRSTFAYHTHFTVYFTFSVPCKHWVVPYVTQRIQCLSQCIRSACYRRVWSGVAMKCVTCNFRMVWRANIVDSSQMSTNSAGNMWTFPPGYKPWSNMYPACALPLHQYNNVVDNFYLHMLCTWAWHTWCY